MRKMVLFSDLDGSLLDPVTYSFDAAREGLQAVRTQNIPLVLATSKTRAEIEPIRFRLEHHDPFIVENGGGIFVPNGIFNVPLPSARVRGSYQVVEVGTPYGRLRAALKDMAAALGRELRGFGDMPVTEIAARTGLTETEALAAKQREYDEPFVIEGTAPTLEELQRLARLQGLTCTRGGRFYHLVGAYDKGLACRLLIEAYRGHHDADGPNLLTIGIGDSLNDLPMLRAVDRPILVQQPGGAHAPEVQLPNLTRQRGIGPEGWNRAVLSLVAESSGLSAKG